MSATDTFENSLLGLIFQNNNIANIGDAIGLRGSAAAGSFYIALLTADPGETGSLTAEATYGDYARVAVPRSSAGFTISGSTVSNAALVSFPISNNAVSNIITHFAIVTALTGGTVLIKGSCGSLAVSNGIQPQFAAGALTATAD